MWHHVGIDLHIGYTLPIHIGYVLQCTYMYEKVHEKKMVLHAHVYINYLGVCKIVYKNIQ